MIERVPRGCGYLAVSRDFAFGNRKDDSAEGGVSKFVWPRAVLRDSANQLPGQSGRRLRGFRHRLLLVSLRA
jgi:hypothetical protein